jgi:hypothetical protein
MIARVLGLGPARRIPEMVRQFAAERPLDEGFLESPDGRIEILRQFEALPASVPRTFVRNGSFQHTLQL